MIKLKTYIEPLIKSISQEDPTLTEARKGAGNAVRSFRKSLLIKNIPVHITFGFKIFAGQIAIMLIKRFDS